MFLEQNNVVLTRHRPAFYPAWKQLSAFAAGVKTRLRVMLDNRETVLQSWTGDSGLTSLQEIPGLAGMEAGVLRLTLTMLEGAYMGITEVQYANRPTINIILLQYSINSVMVVARTWHVICREPL